MVESKKGMTKSQIATWLGQKADIPKAKAVMMLDELTELATSQTKKVGWFTVPGMGKLVLSKRKARMGRNPATGEPIKIPAKTVVKMRLAKACKEAIVPPSKK